MRTAKRKMPGPENGDTADTIRARWLDILEGRDKKNGFPYPDDHPEREKIMKQIEELCPQKK